MTWRALFENPVVMSMSTWMRHKKFLEKPEELFKHDKHGQRYKVGERLWLNVDSSEPEFLEVFPIPGGERVRLFSVTLKDTYEFDTTQPKQLKALRHIVSLFVKFGEDEADKNHWQTGLAVNLEHGKRLPDLGASHVNEEYLENPWVKQTSLGGEVVLACGQCFPWAYQNVVDKGGVLVQGTVTEPMSSPPSKYLHAWVERGAKVYDWQTMVQGQGGKFRGKGFPQRVFYELFQPENMKRYNDEQAMIKLVRSGHYGPWT